MAISSSSGFLLGGSMVVGAACSVVVFHFAQREVSWISFFTSLLGFVLSFGIVALIPYDVWEALMVQGAKDDIVDPLADETPRQLAHSSWELIYWTTFVLCWLLCPVLIEYEAAGDFTTLARVKTSLRRNAVWYATYLLLGSLVLLWLAIGGGDHTGFEAWCIAASNAWGLLVSAVLMGYGLVAVPRHLWRMASPCDQLATLHCVTVKMDEARLSTQFELQDVISEARAEVATRRMGSWDPQLEEAFAMLQATLEESEQLHCELTNGARGLRESGHSNCVGHSRGDDDAAKVESLAQLHRALKQSGLEAQRAACRWDQLVQRCLFLEDLQEQMFPSALEVEEAWKSACPCGKLLCRMHGVRSCWHSLVLLWLRTLRSRVFRLLGGACGLLSCTIVIGQLTMFSEGWSMSLLALFFQSDHGFGLTQALCMLPLGYLVCTAYWSMFQLKIAGWYGLYPNHNTDTGSLLWCASILARTSAPLCYHFLKLVQVKGTAFQAMMGQMNVVPLLGRSFNQVFPIIVGLLVFCNLFNVYSRLVQFCGLDVLEFEWAPPASGDTGDLLTEGRRLIERERRRRSDDRCLMEMQDREAGRYIPLRLQIAQLIEDGTLPRNWNEYSS